MGDVGRYKAVIHDSFLFPYLHYYCTTSCMSYNNSVGKMLPCYPIEVCDSEAAVFIFRQLISCTIFRPLWRDPDAALPSTGEQAGGAGLGEDLAIIQHPPPPPPSIGD